MILGNFEQGIELLKDINTRNELRIKYLEEENKKLKEEHFKDGELAKMKSELETARKNLYRGFPISEDEDKKIEDWCNKHDVEKHGLNTLSKKLASGGCIGGRYSYHFVPTSIGTVGKVVCEKCGESFTFQDLV